MHTAQLELWSTYLRKMLIYYYFLSNTSFTYRHKGIFWDLNPLPSSNVEVVVWKNRMGRKGDRSQFKILRRVELDKYQSVHFLTSGIHLRGNFRSKRQKDGGKVRAWGKKEGKRSIYVFSKKKNTESKPIFNYENEYLVVESWTIFRIMIFCPSLKSRRL